MMSTTNTSVSVPVTPIWDCPVRLSTMGRTLDEDLAYFLAAAAAGRHARRLLRGEPMPAG